MAEAPVGKRVQLRGEHSAIGEQQSQCLRVGKVDRRTGPTTHSRMIYQTRRCSSINSKVAPGPWKIFKWSCRLIPRSFISELTCNLEVDVRLASHDHDIKPQGSRRLFCNIPVDPFLPQVLQFVYNGRQAYVFGNVGGSRLQVTAVSLSQNTCP